MKLRIVLAGLLLACGFCFGMAYSQDRLLPLLIEQDEAAWRYYNDLNETKQGLWVSENKPLEIRRVKVPVEVPVEVIREIPVKVIKEVEVVKEIEVIKEVIKDTPDWRLGDEIIPYPFVNEWADCPDVTAYSFLYLKALYRDFDIKIMYGPDPHYPPYYHVWLLVSDNETSLVYDWGLPVEDIELYKGREISYKQLVGYVYRDL